MGIHLYTCDVLIAVHTVRSSACCVDWSNSLYTHHLYHPSLIREMSLTWWLCCIAWEVDTIRPARYSLAVETRSIDDTTSPRRMAYIRVWDHIVSSEYISMQSFNIGVIDTGLGLGPSMLTLNNIVQCNNAMRLSYHDGWCFIVAISVQGVMNDRYSVSLVKHTTVVLSKSFDRVNSVNDSTDYRV